MKLQVLLTLRVTILNRRAWLTVRGEAESATPPPFGHHPQRRASKAAERRRASVSCSVCCKMRERALPYFRRHEPFACYPSLLFSLLLLSLFCISSVIATPASLPFSECTAGNAIEPSLKINASTVYGQIVTNDELGRHLNLTVIGNTGQTIEPISNSTDLLGRSFRIVLSYVLLTNCEKQRSSPQVRFCPSAL